MKNAKINNKNLVATSIATAILVITGSTPVIGAANITNTVTPAPNNGATTTTEVTTADHNRVNNAEITAAMSAFSWCTWWPWC